MENHKALKIEWRKLSSLKPYKNNPRVISQDAIAKVAKSIERFGWRQPIVADGDGVIVVGHTRFEAAKSLKLSSVPVHVAKDLSNEDAKAYRIADNRVAEESEWNNELLSEELQLLENLDFDIDLSGFNEAEFASLLSNDDLTIENEWEGMPEYVSEDKEAFRTIKVHFKDQSAIEKFFALVGQKLTDKTKMLWFPKIEIETSADKKYVSGS